MIDLVATVAEVLAGYTEGETFLSNQGNQVAIAYHQHVVPTKTDTEDVPFCWVHRKKFTVFPRRSVQVAAEFLLYDTSDAQAAEEAQRLSELLAPLSAGRQFTPWKLDAAQGFEGDEASGLNPPHHRLYTYLLEFSSAR